MDYREAARKETARVESKIAKFTNYTAEEFIGYWDGKKHTFKPGQSRTLQAYKAFHFAKALANRELLTIKTDPTTKRILRLPDGTPDYVVPNGDKYVSPKKPADVPEFSSRVKKAFQMIDNGEDEEMDNSNKELTSEMTPAKKEKDVQIADFPDDPDDDDEFEGKPKEETTPPNEPKKLEDNK